MTPTYSRRDYQAFALQLKAVTQDLYDRGKYAELEGAYQVIGRIADLFAMDNPRFNRNAFWQACSEDK